MEKIAQKFLENQNLNKEEFVKLIRCAHDPEVRELLAERALELRKKYYGDKVYTEVSLSLPITVKITAITAVFAGATGMRNATG